MFAGRSLRVIKGAAFYGRNAVSIKYKKKYKKLEKNY